LIGVNTYPSPVALHSKGKTKIGCVALHLLGAMMMFVGYLICEWKCLKLWPFTEENPAYKTMIVPEGDAPTSPLSSPPAQVEHTNERWWRRLYAYVILIAFFLFGALQIVMFVVKDQKEKTDLFCCADTWLMRGETFIINGTDKNSDNHTGNATDATDEIRLQTVTSAAMLLDTASGNFFRLKVASFIMEDIAGVALVLSHLCIWYFCSERHTDWMDVELKDISKCAGHHERCPCHGLGHCARLTNAPQGP